MEEVWSKHRIGVTGIENYNFRLLFQVFATGFSHFRHFTLQAPVNYVRTLSVKV